MPLTDSKAAGSAQRVAEDAAHAEPQPRDVLGLERLGDEAAEAHGRVDAAGEGQFGGPVPAKAETDGTSSPRLREPGPEPVEHAREVELAVRPVGDGGLAGARHDAYLDHLEAHPHGYRALYRGAAGADTEIRAILEANHLEQQRRILGWLTQGKPATEQLRLLVHGWFAGIVAMCLDWLDQPVLDRAELRDLCIGMLTAVAASAGYPVEPREAGLTGDAPASSSG